MAGALRGGEHGLDRLLAGAEVGREATLVADTRRQPTLVQQAFQRVEHLGADLQRLGKRRCAGGHDHELLEVE